MPVLVPTRAQGYVRREGAVHIAGPDALDGLVEDLDRPRPAGYQPRGFPRRERVSSAAHTGEGGSRAAAERRTSTHSIGLGRDRAGRRGHSAKIVHEAARTKTRHLMLVTGVPGAGKTLVGLQTVHAHYLDDLASTEATASPRRRRCSSAATDH